MPALGRLAQPPKRHYTKVRDCLRRAVTEYGTRSLIPAHTGVNGLRYGQHMKLHWTNRLRRPRTQSTLKQNPLANDLELFPLFYTSPSGSEM